MGYYYIAIKPVQDTIKLCNIYMNNTCSKNNWYFPPINQRIIKVDEETNEIEDRWLFRSINKRLVFMYFEGDPYYFRIVDYSRSIETPSNLHGTVKSAINSYNSYKRRMDIYLSYARKRRERKYYGKEN